MTSITEVARRAQVSKATVSNALNRPELVAPATRQRIEAVIAELRFIPNQQARQLSGISSTVLGLVVIDAANPFFTAVTKAIEEAAAERGHVVILCNSGGSQSKEQYFLRLLAGQRVRGVVLNPWDARVSIEASPLPTVLLDQKGTSEECSVSVDDVLGGTLAAAHLLELGHRRLAFVGGPEPLRQHRERHEGAREAARPLGLDPEAVIVPATVDGIDIADGIRAAEQILAWSERPTGVLCANDLLAFGVHRGLTHAGIRVPEDISVVGYDDIDFAADWVTPLTTVRQPTHEIGRHAAELLFEHSSPLDGHLHRQIVLTPDLSVRQSSAPPRN